MTEIDNDASIRARGRQRVGAVEMELGLRLGLVPRSQAASDVEGGELAFNVFDNAAGGGDDKGCCGTSFPQIWERTSAARGTC